MPQPISDADCTALQLAYRIIIHHAKDLTEQNVRDAGVSSTNSLEAALDELYQRLEQNPNLQSDKHIQPIYNTLLRIKEDNRNTPYIAQTLSFLRLPSLTAETAPPPAKTHGFPGWRNQP
ncbi:MAG: hypothetical protein ACOYK8_04550 [Alphaproteobacteria bacterium]